MTGAIQISHPYLVFLGDNKSQVFAKTAYGLAQWAPDSCVGQLCFPECETDAGLPNVSVTEAASAGAKSLVLAVAPIGGTLQKNWFATILEAIDAGLDIVSGLHDKLSSHPELVEAASKKGVKLIDVRIPPENLPVGNGKKRTGKRLLTVGADCGVGKKYAALVLAKTLQERNVDCDFRATGQTGIMISGNGIPIDSVVADFVAGAAELVSPNNRDDHWDLIEGQGSILHPGYSGVSLGLLHGSQPDAIVVCHDPGRDCINGYPDYPISDISDCITNHLQAGRLTNPNIRCVGVCVNTSKVDASEREALLQSLERQTSLPCVDPLIDGVDAIVDSLMNTV
jgi:uncharacterized NAD-dependent epimerase/dehydratase family protein